MFSKSIQRGISLGTLSVMLSLSMPLAYADNYSSSYSSTTTTTSSSTPARQTYTIPAGTNLSVRTIGGIPRVAGADYTGETTAPVMVNGVTVIPTGSEVSGELVTIAGGANEVRLD